MAVVPRIPKVDVEPTLAEIIAPEAPTLAKLVAAPAPPRRIKAVHGGRLHDPYAGAYYGPEPGNEVLMADGQVSHWLEVQLEAKKLEVVR